MTPREGWHPLSLRFKTLFIVCTCLIAGFLIMAASSWFIFLKHFRAIEEERLVLNLNRAVDALNENLRELDTTCQDWSGWNESYAFVRSGDPSFLTEKLRGDVLRRLNVNFVAMTDSSGRLLIMRAYDEAKNSMVAPSEALAAHFTSPDPALLACGEKEVRIGILLLPEGPMLIAARPILKADSSEPSVGTLVMGRYFQADELRHLSSLTHLDISLAPLGRHPFQSEFEVSLPLAKRGRVRVSTRGTQTIVGFMTINDLFGKPALLLSVTMPRNTYREGLTTIVWFMLALVIVGAATLYILNLLLNRFLVSRLRNLAKEVSSLAPESSLRPSDEPGPYDELTMLEVTVHRTFDELSLTQRALRASRENLESQVAERTTELARANEELLQKIAQRQEALESLRQSEERFRGTLDNMLEGCQIIGFDWRYLYVNDSVARHGRRSKQELLGRTMVEVYPGIAETEMFRVLKRCMEERKPRRMENQFYYGDGSSAWFDLSILPVPEGAFILSNEITERKQFESEQEITARVLSIINSSDGLKELVHGVSLLLAAWFGCDAVGIRLREGDDFPYFETRGFTPDFVLAENKLCLRDPSGEIMRDSGGNPCLDCMCGNVLCGRFNSEKPFFTQRGSFWTNSTTELLAGATEADRQSIMRDRCHAEGFESVALVALRVGPHTYGLLQVSDKRKDQFSTQRVALLERLADSVATAVAHRFSQESLRLSEERYRRLVEMSPDAIFIHADGKCAFANPAGLQLLGASNVDQVIGRPILDVVHPDYHGIVKERVRHQVEGGQLAPLLEEKFLRLDGTPVDVEVSGVPSEYQGKKAVQVLVRDITARKRLEVTRAATYQISEAAISCPSLPELYAAIHGIVGRLMDTRNFYISLYEPEEDLFTYPYWVDEYDPQPEPEKPGKSLTAYVFRMGKPLLASPEVFQKLVDGGEVESMGAPSIDWLGVPLKTQDKTTGVLVVQTYQEGIRYGKEDLEILSFVSSQVAMAIERKRAEEALRRSEERYRALVENQGEGVTYVGPDQVFTFANPAAEDIFGVPPGTLVGRNVLELTSPEFMAEAVAQSEMRKRGAKSTYETEIIRPDGQRRSLLLTAVPMKDKTGAYAGNLAVFFDITGRRRTETERQLLATAIEQSSEGMLVTDPEGIILYANRAMESLTGYSRPELLGRNPRMLKSGLQDKGFYQNFWSTILAGRVWSGRFANKKKGGEIYSAECTVSPVTDSSGTLTAFVCSQRDVTKELQWEEELQRARRLETVGLLAGVVAHEVRNPLFAISTLCAALDKNLGEAEQFRPFTARIQEQVKKLGRLMSDLLMLGRPLDLARFVPCNIREIIAEAIAGLEEAGESKAERFSIEAPDYVPDMRGLPDRLVQVFQNLALNALHHSPPEEPIRIAIAVLEPELRVTVSDLGPGLPKDLGVRVFEPFQSRRSGGTGLGLAVVRQIVEAHGGRVAAENNDPGPGATFTVWLPLPNESNPA